MRHLQSFKYVKTIAEAGSIRSAAESLIISPSALNRHIQTLELDIGFRIFDRLTRGVRLSTEGELFYQFALRQMASFEQLNAQINDLKGLRTGVVRLGVSADLNQRFIHKQIAKYQSDHPEVAFNLKTIDQSDLENQFNAGHLDLALFYQPILGRNLQVIHAIAAQVHVAMPNGAPVKNSNSLKLYELIDHAVLMPIEGTQLRYKIDVVCEKLGISLRTKMECADPLPHLSVTNNSRIAFCLPFADDFDEYARKGFKLVPLTSKEFTAGYVNLMVGPQNILSLAPQKFAESIIAQFEGSTSASKMKVR